jgi:transposase
VNLVIAVDIAKTVLEIAISRRPGRVEKRQRLSRSRFMRFFAQQQPAAVLLEACGSAHYWARRLQELGHTVTLLPPHLVKPYRCKGNKTDRADAKALLEASRNDEIIAVPVKSVDQQALTALHRFRSRWVATRTARINTLRGVLRELGFVIPVGARHVVTQVRCWVGDPDSGVPDALRPTLADVCEELRQIEERIRSSERQLEALARQLPAVARLRTIPGVGLLTATALVAFVGDAKRFRTGRHFASFLGLTPKEHSSGCVRRLGAISKRGDAYLRTLLIHGSRAVLLGAKRQESPNRLAAWALELQRRRGHNIAAVAIANKLARIAWATWTSDTDFKHRLMKEAA